MNDERKQRAEDAAFADSALRALPSVPVPAALEARILADFDAIAAQLRRGALSRLLRRWQNLIWPGAPLWKPASVLALSLIIGLTAGVLVPSTTLSGEQTVSSPSYDTAEALEMSGEL